MTLRVSFLVDGFNLYHSVEDAQKQTGACGKWLNLRAFCESYLHLFGRDARLEEIHYFSAYANHLTGKKPDTVARHQLLVRALESTGIKVEMGQFKSKTVRCQHCSKTFIRHEEKETDVAIAVRLVELVVSDRCDIAVVLTGDTDVAPAIRTAKHLASTKRIAVLAPYNRANAELKQIAHQFIKVKAETYGRFLFPNEVTAQNGDKLTKPASW